MSEPSSDKDKVVAIMAVARESIDSLARLDRLMSAQIPSTDDAGAFRAYYLKATSIWCKAFADMQNIAFAAWLPDTRMIKVGVALDLLKRVLAARDGRSCANCGTGSDDDGVPGLLVNMIRDDLNVEQAELDLCLEARKWAEEAFKRGESAIEQGGTRT